MSRKPTQRKKTMNAVTKTTADTTSENTPRTLEQKLEAARALVAKYEAAIVTAAILNNVEVGDEVSFKYGRAEKVRVLDGTVRATRTDENGVLWARVETGEDFDIAAYSIRAMDITANTTAQAREAAEPTVSADSDPLNAE